MTDGLLINPYRFGGVSYLFQDDWTGTNGAAWNAAKWQDATVTGTSTITIESNQGRFVAQGAAYAAVLISGTMSAATDMNLLMSFQLTGAGEQYPDIFLRSNTTYSSGRPTNCYFVEFGVGSFIIYKRVAGTITALALGDASYAHSTGKRWVRFEVTGTTVRLRFWNDGASEPGTWAQSVTDSALASGGVALAYQNGAAGSATTINWDDLTIS